MNKDLILMQEESTSENFYTKYRKPILYFSFAAVMYFLNLLIQWINLEFLRGWIENNLGHLDFIQTFYLATEPFNMPELVGSIGAVLITYIIKFILDKLIVFEKKGNLKQAAGEFSLYFIFAILTTIENVGIQFLLSNFLFTPYWLSLFVALTIGYITKFFLDKKYVFNTEMDQKVESAEK